MGKRFSFERRPADFYPTPKAAVLPLIPYLRAAGIKTFAEPCCGDGDLVRHLAQLAAAAPWHETGIDPAMVDVRHRG